MKVIINSQITRKPVLRLKVNKRPLTHSVCGPQKGYSIGGLSIPVYANRHREYLLQEMVYKTIERGLLSLSQEQEFALLDKALFLNEREKALPLSQLLFRKECQLKSQVKTWEMERRGYYD